MSTYKTMLSREIRKILRGYPFLSGVMRTLDQIIILLIKQKSTGPRSLVDKRVDS